jgi:predicted outer membrane repeat protein
MYTDGLLAVHDNVVFKANTAAANGGAVSLRSSSIAHHAGVS